MSPEKITAAQVLNNNRTFVIILLGVPVFGMLLAVALILYTKPENMVVAFGVILFIAVQYILMMFFLLKRIEMLAKKDDLAKGTDSQTSLDAPNIEEDKNQLLPEERRVFPIPDEDE